MSMRTRDVLALAASDVRATWARATISAAGIGVGVAVLTLIIALGLGARDIVLEELVQELPVDTIEVLPKTVDLGLFEVTTDSLFGAKTLDQRMLAALASIEGVAHAYPKLEVKLPLGARGGGQLFGRNLYTDLFMTGLPAELLRQEVEGDLLTVSDTGAIPIVISSQLIEIYNSSVAPSLGTPRLTAQTLKGFEFEIVVGRSLMLGTRGAVRSGVERGRIVGASRFAMRLGATVPIEAARRLMRSYGEAGGDANGANGANSAHEEIYASVLLKARSAADVPDIAAAVEQLGFAVDKTAEQTRDVLNTATTLASLVGILVLALAALNIAHSFFASLSERRRELGILRALGARRIDLVLLVLVQAALLGAVGGLLGLVLARTTALAVDAAATAWLPSFPFKPDTFFVFPWTLYAGSAVAAVVAAIVGAAWPAVAAARAEVVSSLSAG